jgi:formylglycine-generating enzyme required for sulfatase activity
MPRATKRSLPLLALVLAAPLLVPAPPSSSAPAPVGPPKKLTNSIGMKLVCIPAGKFLMGSPDDEPDRYADHEGPRHEVQITKAFYLGAFEVTQAQYQKVMGTNPSSFSAGGHMQHQVRGMNTDDFPVDSVSYQDGIDFCTKLSALPAEKAARRVYRLPTEAQWEYACRAGTKTPFHFGKSLSSRQANFNGSQPYGGAAKGPTLGRPCKVGSYKPNAWGLYDMHGNLWEWVADRYAGSNYTESPRKDPHCKTGARYICRGGGWGSAGWMCRAAHRAPGWQPGGWEQGGFRVACIIGGPR